MVAHVLLLVLLPLVLLTLAGLVLFVVGQDQKRRGLWVTGIILGAVGLAGLGLLVLASACMASIDITVSDP